MAADILLHENTRNTPRTPAAEVSGHDLAPRRSSAQRGGPIVGRFAGCHLPMAGCLSTRWSGGPESQTASRSQAQADQPAARQIAGFVAERSLLARLPQPALDAKACGQGDLQALCCPLRPFGGLACAKKDGLELPEARASGPGTRRVSHRPMADQGLAAYKKTPEKPAVTSFFWTKPALCSSRPYVGLGHLRGKRRFSTVGTATTACRVSRRSASRHNVDGWVCTLTSGVTIFVPMMSSPLWASCWDSFPGASFWSGIVGRSIVPPLDGWPDAFGVGCNGNGCRPMPRSSIRWRVSGTKPNMRTWLILSLTMWPTSGGRFGSRCGTVALSKICCVPFSNMPSSTYEKLLFPFKGQ